MKNNVIFLQFTSRLDQPTVSDSRIILTFRVEPQYLLWTMAHAMRLIPHLYNKQGKIKNDEARKERYERLLDACRWMLDRIMDDKRLVRVR